MSKQRITLAALGAAALFAASCAQLPASGDPNRGAPALDSGAEGWNGSRLYARDGSVVGQAPASSDARTAAPRELAASDGGRMYILELYQKTIEERDALQGELASLRAELRTVQEALVASDADLDGADAEIERLRAENKRLLEENIDLAARLTTAQIRRLQVEKILLEMRVEELKALQAAAASTAPVPPAAESVERKL
jgi:septal ring factor EnvC (AmiA/AmiB activator)